MALARILATMHDAKGRVSIKGFYDKVRPFPPAVRKGMRALPFKDAAFKREVGVTSLGGESGYTTLEKLWTRPTCEVNGLLSGYTGEGAKTVLPAKAGEKGSGRLARDQTPRVMERLRRAQGGRAARSGV